MKVKFNKPNRRYTNKFSFDNNTTFGIGNVQPLFCKQMCAGSKMCVTFNQLTRLSPLVVPTFARLKQRNDFVFVPMSMVMPSFDAFLSRSLIHGTNKDYVPSSVPCTTNLDLFLSLIFRFSVCAQETPDGKFNISDEFIRFVDSYNYNVEVKNVFFGSTKVPTSTELLPSYFDFYFTPDLPFAPAYHTNRLCIKLTTPGRFWLSVLRGLGYSLDPFDTTPVSILPLWAFAKAYFDVYYPKRYNPWHASNYYGSINSHYNGDFVKRTVGGLDYDVVKACALNTLFGSSYGFDFFATIDDSLVTAATELPINQNSAASNNTTFDNANWDTDANYSDFDVKSNVNGQPLNDDNASYVPALSANLEKDVTHTIGITADQLRLVDKLWSFVQKSSVVGQSVKDWFAVHLGVKPNEDMFDQTTLVDSIVNDVSINTVVSTAQTSDGAKGDNLGALAGQGYAAKNGSVKFEAKTFGFFMCLTSLVPVSGVSCGTQPELYQNTLYEQQMPDFDGLGYEVLNKSSFEESVVSGNTNSSSSSVMGGFGYVPRLSSWKCLHNIRSGNFAVNSVKDSLLPYNVDVLPIRKSTAGSHWRFPWAFHDDFLSFNRMFYNVEPPQRVIGSLPPAPLDDNFMCQTSFDFSYTSYLKPLSDSYSIEALGKDLVSVKEQ